MKFVIDHDYHIHTFLSSCSRDPEQTPERLLRYAEENGLKDLCLTNHFWDPAVDTPTKWYEPQDFDHVASARPLPQSDKVRFHFGCEADLNEKFIVGMRPELQKEFDLIVIPFTHMHMTDFVPKDTPVDQRAVLYVHRMHALFDSDLPDGRVGVAHMTTPLIAKNKWTDHIQLIETIPDSVFYHQFAKAAKRKFAIELNFTPAKYAPEELQAVLRPYFIAKECGCKFYLGSDAHTGPQLEAAMQRFTDMVDALSLTEDDKFRPFQ